MYQLIFNKKFGILFLALLLVALSWAGIFDELSSETVDSSIIEAGTAYAAARGINALVSVLQTSTVQIGVGIGASMTIGELLDPLNDLIERFSQVMTLALSSLVIQKILLVAATHGAFKMLLTLFGALSVIFLCLGKVSALSVVWRLFVILVFIRFALVIVVSMNSLVDDMFLSERIEEGTKSLGVLKDDISRLKQADEAAPEEKSESWFKDGIEKIKRFFPALNELKKNLDPEKIGAMITESVDNIINLLVLFVLKTVFIPLIFLYCFIKVVKFIWKIDWNPIIDSKVEIVAN